MKMEKTSMEFVAFDTLDVIATSGTFTLSGYKNGTSNDMNIRYNGEDYSDWDSLANAYSEVMHDNPEPTFRYFVNGDEYNGDFDAAFTEDGGDEEFFEAESLAANGVYKWIEDQTTWLRQ